MNEQLLLGLLVAALILGGVLAFCLGYVLSLCAASKQRELAALTALERMTSSPEVPDHVPEGWS